MEVTKEDIDRYEKKLELDRKTAALVLMLESVVDEQERHTRYMDRILDALSELRAS